MRRIRRTADRSRPQSVGGACGRDTSDAPVVSDVLDPGRFVPV